MLQVFLTIQSLPVAPDGTHRVVSVAAVEAEGYRATGREFHSYLNPGAPIVDETALPDGLMLGEQASFINMRSELEDLLRNATLISHSPRDAIHAFQREWKEGSRQFSSQPLPEIRDGAAALAVVSPGEPFELRDLCARWLIDVEPSPRTALAEARMLAAVVLRCQDVLVQASRYPDVLAPELYRSLMRHLTEDAPWPEGFGVAWLQRRCMLGYGAAMSVMNQLIVSRVVAMRSDQRGLIYERGSLAPNELP